MIINTSHISKKNGLRCDGKYEELDTFDSILSLPVTAAGAFCFHEGKLVLVYAKSRECWEIPGGGREPGESFEACITREIKEESNMRVIALFPLGCDTFAWENGETNYILRYAAKVEPYGDFVEDADGEITKIELIDPADYKQYFDWGERGDAMMKRALLLSKSF